MNTAAGGICEVCHSGFCALYCVSSSAVFFSFVATSRAKGS